MEDHVRLVAILNIVLGSLGVAIALLVLLLFGGVAGIVMHEGDPDAGMVVSILVMVGTIVFFALAILSVPSLIGGIGLLKFRAWSRILMIIVSILNLIHIPFGTIVGVYGLWVLLNDETTRLLKAKNA